MKMTTEEAFVKTLQRHGIQHAFGIIGSAMMPISDLFHLPGSQLRPRGLNLVFCRQIFSCFFVPLSGSPQTRKGGIQIRKKSFQSLV